MTSVSASNSLSQLVSTQRPQHHGGGTARISDAIDAGESSGQISATDATALTSALDSIDSSLSADRASSSGAGSSGARLDPSQMKDRIDGLIADQVSAGTLTSDQAATLKQLFAQGPGGGRDGAVSGAGAGEAGGIARNRPPPPPPPGDSASLDASGQTSSPDDLIGSSSSTASRSANDLLTSFIQQLQQSQPSAAGYTGSGSGGSRVSAALLVDFRS